MELEQLHESSYSLESIGDATERERITQEFNQIVDAIREHIPEDVAERLSQEFPMGKICGGSDGPGAGLGHN